MATPFPPPIEQGARLSEQILSIIRDRGRRNPTRTAMLVELLPNHAPTAIRASLGRMQRRGEIESPGHGWWRPLLHGHPAAERPGHPHSEVVLPGARTEDVLRWAANVAEANPISAGVGLFDPTVEVEVEEIFMGVELTFKSGERKVFSLALFADVPTPEEEATMEAQVIGS